MKTFLSSMFLAVMVAFFAMPEQASAQTADTVWIQPTPAGNLNTVINGDTTATGERNNPNRVYGLLRTKVYNITSQIKVTGNLHLIADKGTGRPPVIAPAILLDNSSPSGFFKVFGNGSKVTFKNIYMLYFRADDTRPSDWGMGIEVQGDSVSVHLDGCVLDAFSGSGMRGYGRWGAYVVTNCTFRNMQEPYSYYSGQPFICTGLPMDTVKFVNNTFLCNNSYVLAISQYDNYTLFEHNTIFLSAVHAFYIYRVFNADIKNNIFYGMEAIGYTPNDVAADNGRSPGLISIDTSRFVVDPPPYDPVNRKINLLNNAYYWPSELTDFYTTYNDTTTIMEDVNGVPTKKTITPTVWMDSFTDSLFAHQNALFPYPNLNESGTINEDPAFDAGVRTAATGLANFVGKIYSNTLDGTLWYYNPTGDQYPPTWPLPENLRYTNVAMQTAGTDGKALGDLNWFPEQIGVEEEPNGPVPTGFALAQNYPNPFNPSTVIRYSIPKAAFVTLKVYNTLGQEVATLVNAEQAAKTHEVTFDASKISSGIYFYTVRAGNFVSTKKMMLIK